MIEHTTLCNNQLINSSGETSTFVSYLNAILSTYEWESGSEVITGSDLKTSYGKYYFTTNSYIKIYCDVGNSYYLKIDIVTPNGTENVFSGDSSFFTFSVGKTDKGICICAYSGKSSNTRDPYFYNLYVGEVTLLDGTLTKGCVYVAYDNSYIVATDKGISSESAFVANIDNTRKAYLAPATDSTNGGIFKDIYMMACAPVQYNKFKIVDTGNKYLAGKAICLAD